MKKVVIVALLLVLTSIVVVTAAAQDAACVAAASETLAAFTDACGPIGSGTMCVNLGTANSSPLVGEINDYGGLRFNSLSADANIWGLGNGGLTNGSRVAIVGGVEYRDVSEAASNPFTTVITAETGINVRESGSISANVVGGMQGNESAEANGRNADATWLRVQLSEDNPAGNVVGWVFTELIVSEGDLLSLPEVGDNDLAATPASSYEAMQAINFRSIGDSNCAGSSPAGLFLTSAFREESSFLINGALIRVNGVVFVTASNDEMTVGVMQGTASVTINRITKNPPLGAALEIPLVADAPITSITPAAVGNQLIALDIQSLSLGYGSLAR
jgi:uncharacterized protein YgiM (DUF1202 family)